MFSEDEIEALGEHAYSSPRYELDDFLNAKEIEVIKDGGSRANTLLNRIFIPKHSNETKTIRIQHLMVNLIVEDWLLGIADCLRYSKIITINVGFSYLVWKPENDIRYVYAAKALSFARAKLQSKSEFYDFASTFRPMNDSDLLQNTFLSQLKGNVFESSGFTPQTLVCAYCWITK